MNERVAKIVDSMTAFASKTKNDQLSVEVARVATRLQHQGTSFEKPLTRREISIVEMFDRRIAA